MSRPFILFDVMDTLVFDPAYTVLPKIFDAPIGQVWKDANPQAWPAFERGELSEEEYFRNFFRDQRAIDGERIKRELTANYRWLDGMREILNELKNRDIEMHILSNYPIWYRDIEAKLGLSEFLPWTFVSHETGRRKPKPESYLAAAEHLGAPVSKGLFIDDREKNCQAARELGMDAIIFNDARQLRKELHARGFFNPYSD